MNNSHITFEVVTPKKKASSPRQPTIRLKLHSHGLKHPLSRVIVQYDTRSERGFRKRMKELRERRDYINSGGF